MLLVHAFEIHVCGREEEGKSDEKYVQALNSVILMDLFTVKHHMKINNDDGENEHEREKHCVQ